MCTGQAGSRIREGNTDQSISVGKHALPPKGDAEGKSQRGLCSYGLNWPPVQCPSCGELGLVTVKGVISQIDKLDGVTWGGRGAATMRLCICWSIYLTTKRLQEKNAFWFPSAFQNSFILSFWPI